MIGIGIDIVELERVRGIGQLRRFAEYFLLPAEITTFEKSLNPIEFIASRFAAKEAVIKAFPGLLKPHEFEIVKKGKKPGVKFLAKKHERKYTVFVSLAHSIDYAVGYATILKNSR